VGQVNVKVNGRDYQIACGDGEEAHVLKLAEYLENRIGDIDGGERRREGDNLLLVMASLLVVDELADARADLARLTAGTDNGGPDQDALAASMTSLAERVESIAERLNAS
jgi:cell division protein ZapA